MAYLTLLFTSAGQNTSTVPVLSRPAEDEIIHEPAWPGLSEAGSDEVALPSGIHSLEHWMDLNA